MHPVLIADLLGAAAAVLLAGAVGWASYLVASRLVGQGASTSTRWSAAAVAAFWLPVAAFWLLVPFGLFRLPVALALFAVLAAVLHRRLAPVLEPRSLLAGDLRRMREVAAGLARAPAGWLLGAVALGAGVRFLRGTASPPLGWDALTYHLYKAGRWVQLGSLAPQPAPDAWSYYEYFPVVGDVFWAWAMLPLRSDALITAAGTAIWAALLLGVYAAARELGATPERSILAAVAAGALPSVLPYLSSGYVDNTVAALFALGAVFVLRVWRRRTVAEAPLAAAAFGLMVGTKLTAAAFFAVGLGLVVMAVLRSGESGRTRRIVLLACLAAAVAGYPSYQRAWVEKGSPFHPFGISLGGMTLSETVPAAAGIAEEIASWEGYGLESRLDFWRYFLWTPKISGAFLNPGPGGALVVLLGLLGLAAALRDRRLRVGAVFLAACALLMLLGFLSSNMETFRTTLKVTTAGRYVTVGLVATAILGAAWRHRLAPVLWVVAGLASLFLSFPRVWVAAELPALAATAGVVAASAGGFLMAAWWWRRSRRTVLPAAAALLVAAAGVATLEGVRREHRYTLYAAAVDSVDPLFHMHGLNPVYASGWWIWRELDDPEPHRLAVTAGWDGLGHNWYRYPLLGSHLQNRVLYVPVTADGSVVDYRERQELARRARFAAWLTRLVDEGVDYVVSLAPRDTVEDLWMRNAPDLFEPEIVSPGGFHVAYRLDRDAARRTLGARRPAAQVPVP